MSSNQISSAFSKQLAFNKELAIPVPLLAIPLSNTCYKPNTLRLLFKILLDRILLTTQTETGKLPVSEYPIWLRLLRTANIQGENEKVNLLLKKFKQQLSAYLSETEATLSLEEKEEMLLLLDTRSPEAWTHIVPDQEEPPVGSTRRHPLFRFMENTMISVEEQMADAITAGYTLKEPKLPRSLKNLMQTQALSSPEAGGAAAPNKVLFPDLQQQHLPYGSLFKFADTLNQSLFRGGEDNNAIKIDEPTLENLDTIGMLGERLRTWWQGATTDKKKDHREIIILQWENDTAKTDNDALLSNCHQEEAGENQYHWLIIGLQKRVGSSRPEIYFLPTTPYNYNSSLVFAAERIVRNTIPLSQFPLTDSGGGSNSIISGGSNNKSHQLAYYYLYKLITLSDWSYFPKNVQNLSVARIAEEWQQLRVQNAVSILEKDKMAPALNLDQLISKYALPALILKRMDLRKRKVHYERQLKAKEARKIMGSLQTLNGDYSSRILYNSTYPYTNLVTRHLFKGFQDYLVSNSNKKEDDHNNHQEEDIWFFRFLTLWREPWFSSSTANPRIHASIRKTTEHFIISNLQGIIHDIDRRSQSESFVKAIALFPTPVMERWLLNLQPSIPTYEWYSNSNHILHKAIQLNIAAPVNGEMWTLYRLMESECQRPVATPSKSSAITEEGNGDLIRRLLMQSYDKPNSVLQTLTAVSNQLYPNGEVIVAGILNFNRNTEQKQMMVKSNPLLTATHPEYKVAATTEPFGKRLVDAITQIKFVKDTTKFALLGIKYNSTAPSNSDEGYDWLMLRIYPKENNEQTIELIKTTQGDDDALLTLINDELKKLEYIEYIVVNKKQDDVTINKGIGNAIILNQKRRRSVVWAILFPLEIKL